jgi:LPS sulfotransferase NodH
MSGHKTPFVVFTTQRTGSTWLMSVLNNQDGVSGQGELFLPRPRSQERRWDSEFAWPRYVESRHRSGSLRPFSVYRYLRDLYGSPGSVGFKLMYSQLKAFPEILPFLVRENIDVVHLVRRNHIDVLISFALKRQIGRAHMLSAGDRPEDETVELDTGSLVRDLRRLQFKQELGRGTLRLARLRHFEVAYEDLVVDSLHFKPLFDFLRIPFEGAALDSTILRTRTGSQRDVLANYDEVRGALAGSRFSHLLD